MLDAILESVFDVLKALPILLVVYTLLYFLETRMRSTPAMLEKAQQLGPVFGALAGAVPQCGFSAAATTLFCYGYLAPSTLVSVFLSTSDEAIPVLLANPDAAKNVLLLIASKLILAVAAGYLLQWTILRGSRGKQEKITITIEDDCSCCGPSVVGAVFWRTAKTVLFLLITMTIINVLIFCVGEDTLASLLLQGSILQPALCATIGLIPGCAVSVILTELYLTGTLSFGAILAGLSTGAGFGYILLLQDKKNRKTAVKIIAATWCAAVIGGTLVQIFMR